MSDPVRFDCCARLAMGDALVRSRFLALPVHQIAVWDGRRTDEVAGTVVDVERWASTGHDTTVIRVEGTTDVHDAPTAGPIRAMVFTDVTALADCALDLQVGFASVDLGAVGLSKLRGLRIGAPSLHRWRWRRRRASRVSTWAKYRRPRTTGWFRCTC